jgi:hypothetical protein
LEEVLGAAVRWLSFREIPRDLPKVMPTRESESINKKSAGGRTSSRKKLWQPFNQSHAVEPFDQIRTDHVGRLGSEYELAGIDQRSGGAGVAGVGGRCPVFAL